MRVLKGVKLGDVLGSSLHGVLKGVNLGAEHKGIERS